MLSEPLIKQTAAQVLFSNTPGLFEKTLYSTDTSIKGSRTVVHASNIRILESDIHIRVIDIYIRVTSTYRSDIRIHTSKNRVHTRVVTGNFVTRDLPLFSVKCEMAIFFLVNRDFHSSREV